MNPENDTSDNAVLDELRSIRELLSAQSAAALGRDAAARFLAVSVSTLDRLTSAGKVKSVMVSEGRRVWRRADLEKYLNDLN
jgi:excisionase family DNA binding protein